MGYCEYVITLLRLQIAAEKNPLNILLNDPHKNTLETF